MPRGGRRPRRIDGSRVSVCCPGGRWGPRRTRVTECYAVLRAEDVYTAILKDTTKGAAPGARGSATYTVEGPPGQRGLGSASERCVAPRKGVPAISVPRFQVPCLPLRHLRRCSVPGTAPVAPVPVDTSSSFMGCERRLNADGKPSRGDDRVRITRVIFCERGICRMQWGGRQRKNALFPTADHECPPGRSDVQRDVQHTKPCCSKQPAQRLARIRKNVRTGAKTVGQVAVGADVIQVWNADEDESSRVHCAPEPS